MTKLVRWRWLNIGYIIYLRVATSSTIYLPIRSQKSFILRKISRIFEEETEPSWLRNVSITPSSGQTKNYPIKHSTTSCWNRDNFAYCTDNNSTLIDENWLKSFGNRFIANCKGQIQVNKISIETLKIGNSDSDQNCPKLIFIKRG